MRKTERASLAAARADRTDTPAEAPATVTESAAPVEAAVAAETGKESSP